MFRLICLSVPLLLVSFAGGAAAQQERPAAGEPGAKCQTSEAKKKRKSMFGAVLGGVADSVLGRAGVPTSMVGVSLPVGTLLTEAIMSRLDCQEQQQAAAATNEAVRGGVGTSSSWTSTTREGVSGTSTVANTQTAANGTSCVTVDDVIIVDGEETRASKRMCRAPGASGYSVAV